MEKLINNWPISAVLSTHPFFGLISALPKAKSYQSEQVKPEFRLRKSSDFMRVRRSGKSYAHPLIVLIALRNQMDITRIGVAAGRSVGKAVKRNRAKRLLRESIQPLVPQIVSGWDIIIMARQPIREASLKQTQTALIYLLQKARLLESDSNYGN